MEIIDLVKRFSGHSGVTAVNQVWSDERVRTIHFKGLSASAAPMLFAALSTAEKPWKVPVVLFVLNDLEEAGYFYHDLTQMLGESKVLFFPSSYKRAIKYGQKDSANEVLRTEVLTRLVEAPLNPPRGGTFKSATLKSSPLGGVEGASPFVILLTHTPDYIEESEASIADLALAGHTHGGQVTLFGLYAPVTASKYGMRYRTGLKHNRQGIPIIISNGLGTSRHPIRMFAPTDIVIVTLHHTRERR